MYGLRGLGAATVVTDPTTGAQKVVYDTATTVVVPSSGPNVYYDASGAVIGTGSSASPTWIPGVSNTVVGVSAGAIALLMLMKAMR